MPSWTLPGPSKLEEAVVHARTSLPRLLFPDLTDEVIEAMAEVIVNGAGAQVDDWIRMTYILKSDGKWLLEHARERGIYPQDGESDSVLKERIRFPKLTVTPVFLLEMANSILASAGVAGEAKLVELPYSAMFYCDASASADVAEDYGFYSTPQAPTGNSYRYSSVPPQTMVFILPVGTEDSTREAIRDALRTKKAGGFKVVIEVAQ